MLNDSSDDKKLSAVLKIFHESFKVSGIVNILVMDENIEKVLNEWIHERRQNNLVMVIIKDERWWVRKGT